MRAAENDKTRSAINGFLELIKIHDIPSILDLELVIDEVPLVIQDGIRKWVINRLLDNNFISGLCISLNDQI